VRHYCLANRILHHLGQGDDEDDRTWDVEEVIQCKTNCPSEEVEPEPTPTTSPSTLNSPLLEDLDPHPIEDFLPASPAVSLHSPLPLNDRPSFVPIDPQLLPMNQYFPPNPPRFNDLATFHEHLLSNRDDNFSRSFWHVQGPSVTKTAIGLVDFLKFRRCNSDAPYSSTLDYRFSISPSNSTISDIFSMNWSFKA
jgi:hypothetical protein